MHSAHEPAEPASSFTWVLFPASPSRLPCEAVKSSQGGPRSFSKCILLPRGELRTEQALSEAWFHKRGFLGSSKGIDSVRSFLGPKNPEWVAQVMCPSQKGVSDLYQDSGVDQVFGMASTL